MGCQGDTIRKLCKMSDRVNRKCSRSMSSRILESNTYSSDSEPNSVMEHGRLRGSLILYLGPKMESRFKGPRVRETVVGNAEDLKRKGKKNKVKVENEYTPEYDKFWK